MTFRFNGRGSRLTFAHMTAVYAPVLIGGRQVAFPRSK